MRHTGVMLWARHHRVGPSVAVAVIASAVVRGLVLPISSDGSEIEVAPLWIATVCVVPLLFMFTTETDTD
ncbi:hypothetical protein, partial [Acidipropionibacterium thoenii]|uniref:hypothetical protein n=1 Tax=Acidipropionibacterium thoenii TaxID=1751 RepID=UPI003CCC42CB